MMREEAPDDALELMILNIQSHAQIVFTKFNHFMMKQTEQLDNIHHCFRVAMCDAKEISRTLVMFDGEQKNKRSAFRKSALKAVLSVFRVENSFDAIVQLMNSSSAQVMSAGRFNEMVMVQFDAIKPVLVVGITELYQSTLTEDYSDLSPDAMILKLEEDKQSLKVKISDIFLKQYNDRIINREFIKKLIISYIIENDGASDEKIELEIRKQLSRDSDKLIKALYEETAQITKIAENIYKTPETRRVLEHYFQRMYMIDYAGSHYQKSPLSTTFSYHLSLLFPQLVFKNHFTPTFIMRLWPKGITVQRERGITFREYREKKKEAEYHLPAVSRFVKLTLKQEIIDRLRSHKLKLWLNLREDLDAISKKGRPVHDIDFGTIPWSQNQNAGMSEATKGDYYVGGRGGKPSVSSRGLFHLRDNRVHPRVGSSLNAHQKRAVTPRTRKHIVKRALHLNMSLHEIDVNKQTPSL